MRHTLATLALVSALPAAVLAQAIPVRTLSAPDAEWSEPFSGIVGVRELKNGRVIVADNRDKTIQLIDFRGEAKPIGREGAGPGEFGLPMAVFAAPGDTTWVFDIMNSRYLVIDPAGKPVSTFAMTDGGGTTIVGGAGSGGGGRAGGAAAALSRGRAAFGLGFAQGIDTQGRLYFRAPNIRFGDEKPSPVDTTPIVRWDRRTNRLDTVGVLTAPAGPPPTVTRGNGGQDVRVSVRIGNPTPFASSDAYAVTPAGDVAVVRASDYHVDWIVQGRSVQGAPISYERVRVTDADKKAWADARRNATGIMITNDNGNRRTSTAMPPQDGPPPEFPQFKGPFAGSVVAAPNGQVWVQRYMPFDAAPTYDVIDNTGKVVSRVVLPRRTRLLGFGKGTAYLVRTDEDDLQYLQRYLIP